MQWQLPHLANDCCLAVIGQTIKIDIRFGNTSSAVLQRVCIFMYMYKWIVVD